MKKHIKNYIYIILVLLLCLLPLAGMAVSGEKPGKENQEPAPLPKFFAEGTVNTAYLSELGAYFEDHFGFRRQFISINSRINRTLFRESGTEEVVLGKDGWLYYQSSVDDWLGKYAMSPRSIYNAAHNLSLMQSYVEARGKRFLFTVAPNKCTLYPEHLPDRFRQSGVKSNRELLKEELKKQGVHYIDLFSLFAKQEEELYLKQDSHWNNKGAILAYHALLDGAKKRHETYRGISLEKREETAGDLAEMEYPSNAPLEENYFPRKEYAYIFRNKADSVEDNWIVAENPSRKGRLLMYRDSFGNTLLPLMAEEFHRSFYSKLVPCALTENMEKCSPDLVILEKVERHLTMLAAQPPVMEGPVAKAEETVQAEKNGTTFRENEAGVFLWLHGLLDEDFTSKDTRVYIEIDDGEKTPVVREAFLATVTEGGRTSDYGYQLYIKKEHMPAKTCTIKVLAEKDGVRQVLRTIRREKNQEDTRK